LAANAEGRRMNTFDAVVYGALFVAVIAGLNSGFLRSGLTILGYIAAAPLAATATAFISPALAAQPGAPWARNSLLFFCLFLVFGMVLGALSRLVLNEAIGTRIGVADRLAGSMLGAVRVGLVAVMMVLMFDRLIPPGREPDFLRGSQLRPMLSLAGQMGLKSLPPETTAFIDRLKQERRL
jgi:membrane protein required for colicin V production